MSYRPFSALQTFVNDLRIPDQTYITLKLSDVIRFGYDILLNARAIHLLLSKNNFSNGYLLSARLSKSPLFSCTLMKKKKGLRMQEILVRVARVARFLFMRHISAAFFAQFRTKFYKSALFCKSRGIDTVTVKETCSLSLFIGLMLHIRAVLC